MMQSLLGRNWFLYQRGYLLVVFAAASMYDGNREAVVNFFLVLLLLSTSLRSICVAQRSRLMIQSSSGWNCLLFQRGHLLVGFHSLLVWWKLRVGEFCRDFPPHLILFTALSQIKIDAISYTSSHLLLIEVDAVFIGVEGLFFTLSEG